MILILAISYGSPKTLSGIEECGPKEYKDATDFASMTDQCKSKDR
jgi:hypothetical protein